jgi:D-alanyl-lipoteichoic acid acyltransferase DltB (MBOAT superfamily)
MSLFVLGLFEKVVIADGLLAPIVEQVYDTAVLPLDFVAAWSGTLAFAGQIFCDFAGYSMCAIGIAMCLGFTIPDNFRFPYAAIGFSDFWGRWHISLSSWLRDYLYIPLGGSRISNVRTYVNLMLTMLIGGLWHGASWTFVVWGALHGLYLMIERAISGTQVTRLAVWKTTVGKRADDFTEAFLIVRSMFGFAPSVMTTIGTFDVLRSVVPTGCIVIAHWLLRDRTLEDVATKIPAWIISIVLAMMIVTTIMMPGEDRAFIYFQF